MPRKKREILDELERRITGAADLSDDDKVLIREKAAEHVKKARKEKAEAEYLRIAIREEEREYEPTEALEDFYVDLSPYAPYMAFNGTMYFHGITYEVPYSLARSMAEQQWYTWQHQNEIDGHPRRGDLQRKPHLATMNMRTGAVTGRVNTAQGMRG